MRYSSFRALACPDHEVVPQAARQTSDRREIKCLDALVVDAGFPQYIGGGLVGHDQVIARRLAQAEFTEIESVMMVKNRNGRST